MQKDPVNDSRIEKILHLITEFASGNLDAREKPSNKNDDIEGIIGGLNMLGEELKASTVSKNFLGKILDTMVDGLIIADSGLIILDVNPAMELLSGYDAKELVGNSLEKIFGDHDMFNSLSGHYSGNEYFAAIETTCLSKENIKIPVSVSISCINDHENLSDAYVIISHDISEIKERESQILAANQKLSSILEALPDLLFEVDLNGLIHNYYSPHSGRFVLPSMEFIYKNLSEALPASASASIMEAVRAANVDGWFGGKQFEVTIENANLWFEISVNQMIGVQSLSPRFIVLLRDITRRKNIEDELRIAAVTFETNEGIVITDAQARIIRVNSAFQEITGYKAEDVIGKNPRIMSSGRHDKSYYADMWKQLQTRGTWAGEIWDRRKNGQVHPKWLTITAVKNQKGETTQYVGIFNDMTARIKAEEEIRNLAFYDTLTNLPNRRLLMDRLRMALSLSGRTNNFGAVLFLDLDKFKSLNDMKGHEYGDRLLIEVGQRIVSCVREVDTVARLGGDEFIILIEELGLVKNSAMQKAAMIAEKIRSALALPYQFEDYKHFCSTSIGICLYKGSEIAEGVLLKSADMAMYQAKESGRNTVRFFDPDMQRAVENHAELEGNLRNAIEKSQLKLYYQVQVDRDLRPIGAEALIRWEHPGQGFISPTQFIPIAEESNLILDIGAWVLHNACRQLAIWNNDEKRRHLTLSINVSARQFGLPGFVESITSAIQEHGVDPSRLKLELTEHVLLSDVTNVVAKMHALKELGVWLSIDDFGTGYSSLSYLKRLPIHQLKIDQSFVRDTATDPNDAMMVKTIISLAQNFHLNVIAEGVENKEQLDFLVQNGCMAYQGFLFGKPVPLADFEALVKK